MPQALPNIGSWKDVIYVRGQMNVITKGIADV